MDWWMLVLGVALLVFVVFDVLSTTVSVSLRSGPLTSAVNDGVWRVLGALAGDDPDALPLRIAGPLSVSGVILLWWVLLWVGWTLVFSADPQAVVVSTSDAPADASGRWLFAAYTAFTLGYGNYLPTGAWELVSAVALLNGFSLATLTITYLVPIVSAVTDRRRQAALISAAGLTPEEIVEGLHDANGFGALDQVLSTLTEHVLMTAQRHLAYPVIHHYHGRDRRSAFPPSVAAMDEAVTLLRVAATGRQRPNEPLMRMWTHAVDALLERVETPSTGNADVPPPPALEVLDRLGVERIGTDAYLAAMGREADRRRALHGFVRSAHWPWPGRSAAA